MAQWVYHEGLIRRPIAPWADALPQSYSFLQPGGNVKVSPEFEVDDEKWNPRVGLELGGLVSYLYFRLKPNVYMDSLIVFSYVVTSFNF